MSLEEYSALANSLRYWEYASYVAILAIAMGVAAQVIYDFTSWFKSSAWWANKGNKYSAILLVMAAFSQLIVEINKNSINGRMTAILEREAASSNERAAILGKETAVLHERTATLVREVGLRHLNGERFLNILDSEPKGEVEILYGQKTLILCGWLLVSACNLKRPGGRS